MSSHRRTPWRPRVLTLLAVLALAAGAWSLRVHLAHAPQPIAARTAHEGQVEADAPRVVDPPRLHQVAHVARTVPERHRRAAPVPSRAVSLSSPGPATSRTHPPASAHASPKPRTAHAATTKATTSPTPASAAASTTHATATVVEPVRHHPWGHGIRHHGFRHHESPHHVRWHVFGHLQHGHLPHGHHRGGHGWSHRHRH